MAHEDRRGEREGVSRGHRLRRAGKRGDVGLAGFDISYVKMMHFAILEMPRGGIVSLGLGGRAVGVGGGVEEEVVVSGSSRRPGDEVWRGQNKT